MYKNNFNDLKKIFYFKKSNINNSLIVYLKQNMKLQCSIYCSNSSLIQACINFPPQLLLCDIDGMEQQVITFLQEIRTSPVGNWAQFPVLILGSTINERITYQLSDSGADGILKKPFNLGLFANRVNQLLTQESMMVETGGRMLPVPRVKYDLEQKKQIEHEVQTWLV